MLRMQKPNRKLLKPDGYEAFVALRGLLESGTDKGKIIDFLMAEERDAAQKAAQSIQF